jgi:hypothetical protein
LVALASIPTACSREGPPESPEAVKQFGYGPRPNRHVRYQPDVVMIGGGANAVRGVSDNGLTWTIDGNAKGARDLSVGKVMFATSRAVGRVVAIERRGKDLAVMLAPVGFTEVIRDAKIDINTKLPPNAFVSYQSVPPPQHVISLVPMGERRARVRPAVWRQGARRPRLRRVGMKYSGKLSIGDWEIEPYVKSSERSWDQANPDPSPDDPPAPRDNNGLELKEEHKVTAFGLKVQKKLMTGEYGGGGSKDWKIGGSNAVKYGLKFGADVRLIGADIRMRGHLSIADGKVNEPITFVVEGVDHLYIGLLGGSENGTTDNVKLRVEIPAEKAFSIPPVYGVPLAVHLKLKFLVETAFSGANSTMWAKGSYKLDGPIGVENGSLVTPKFSVEKPMIDDIHGILVGASGIVFASEFRWLLGIGTDLAMAGPYAKITVAVGTSRGSFLGFELGGPLSNPLRPIIDCRGVTIKGDAGFGLGLVINQGWSKALDKYHLKTDSELVEKTATFVNESLTSPKSALCAGPG